MAVSEEDYGTWLETVEQTLSDGNIEEYLTLHPEEAGTWIDWPDPSYATRLAASLLLFRQILEDEGAFAGSTVGAVLTTGSVGDEQGRATLTFPAMTTPVVTVSPLDAAADGMHFQAVVQAVTATSVTVRVTRFTIVNVSGFDVLAGPQLAPGVSVHVIVHDAG